MWWRDVVCESLYERHEFQFTTGGLSIYCSGCSDYLAVGGVSMTSSLAARTRSWVLCTGAKEIILTDPVYIWNEEKCLKCSRGRTETGEQHWEVAIGRMHTVGSPAMLAISVKQCLALKERNWNCFPGTSPIRAERLDDPIIDRPRARSDAHNDYFMNSHQTLPANLAENLLITR